MRQLFAGFCLVLLADLSGGARAQLSVTSLTQSQRGLVQDEDSESFSNVFGQFNVDYSAGDFQAGGRFEVYRASVDDRSLTFLSQRYVSWANGSARVVGGNFYGILGRGLTMRAYELPGVILESTQFRRKYTNTFDMEGGMGSWSGDRIEVKALAGRPVAGDIPPGYPDTISTLRKLTGFGSDRRRDWVIGGEVNYKPISQLTVGATGVNILPKASENSYAWSWLAGFDLAPVFARVGLPSVYGNLYAEIANRESYKGEGYGRYLSGNFGTGSFGLSVEYKDFQDFDFPGSGPPQLVREHSAYLLNRNTHVMEPLTESGYQVEAIYAVPGLMTATGNVSRARNQLSETIVTDFEEQFVALDLDFLPDAHTASVFFDWGKDELKARAAMRTGGILLGTTTATGQTFGLDLQLQRGKLPFGPSPWYWDTYAALSWQLPIGLGAAIVMDRSTDLAETDRAATLPVETDPVAFWSLNLSARYDRYDAFLFAGERRGGLACTSGTCFEVLAFRGVDLRLSTRF